MLVWNECYFELFQYFLGFIQVGMFIKDLLEYNVEWGLLGNFDNIFEEINKCICYMVEGSWYKYV